jgi:glyoxylase-like metal-dependent hydrolase (beta-lactamase superfamily II)
MKEERRFGPLVFIPGANEGRYPFCHSVFVEGAGVLIDPGSDRSRLMTLRDDPGVREVWLTHWHEDHLMHLDLFEDVPLRVSEREVEPLSDLDKFLDWYGLDDPAHRAWWKEALKTQFHYRPRAPAGVFHGEEIITLDSLTVEVIPTPGHTPGHLAFFFREPAVLFLGDYDLTRFGPWYGDRDSSIEDTIASVQYLRTRPARVWLTGHEQGVFETEPGELWDRYLNVIAERESKLLAFLSQPRTLEEIVGQWIVYRKPREPKGFFEFGERALMGKHLERLTARGEVRLAAGKYVRVAG